MRYIFLFGLLALGVGCGQVSSGPAIPPTQIVMTGSSTVAPLAAEFAQKYEEMSDVRIDVQTGGSSRGIADARKRLCDIGMVSRALKPDELDLTPHLIARDGICLIVNSENPIAELTSEQIVKIYRGEIENWSDVGGNDAEIVVVHKAEGRSTLELFLAYFQLENLEVKPDIVIGDNQQGIKAILGNPNAIGYVSIGAAEFEVEQQQSLKLLPLEGVEASTAHVQDGTFPLSRELNLVTTQQDPEGAVLDFLRFAQSADVHDLIEGLYFVPVK